MVNIPPICSDDWGMVYYCFTHISSTPITWVYGRYIYILCSMGVINQLITGGAPPCMKYQVWKAVSREWGSFNRMISRIHNFLRGLNAATGWWVFFCSYCVQSPILIKGLSTSIVFFLINSSILFSAFFFFYGCLKGSNQPISNLCWVLSLIFWKTGGLILLEGWHSSVSSTLLSLILPVEGSLFHVQYQLVSILSQLNIP